MENKNKIITFLDAVGRTILGEHNESLSTERDLAIVNPVLKKSAQNHHHQEVLQFYICLQELLQNWSWWLKSI